MSNPVRHNKITPEHLARKAVIYLRQSSERQVRVNVESQKLQYGLKDRARALGFSKVQVIDNDLGSSASLGTAQRQGFQELIASVALGEVGIVLSREISRLSRTDKDWCHLQEVCQVFGTLMGDGEKVYDLNSTDDQLVLGIKATMSIVELKVLRTRLLEGMQEKARRGELFRMLPPGYVLDGTGKVVKDSNQRVRDAIDLIFRQLRNTGSVRQTYLWFHSEGIELPVNKSIGGKVQLVWKLPSHSFVGDVLRNPFYAGAYVWGQRPVDVRLINGKLVKRQGALRRAEDCKVFIRDHHEGYIEWEAYQENLRLIRGNNLRLGMDESVGAVRSGQGLLAGLLRCARCGRKFHMRYWGKSGTAGRYCCIGDYDAGGSYCLAFGGSTVDRMFSEELLRVLSPLGVEASLQAIDQLSKRESDGQQALGRQLQQVEYETQRALEQYDAVDPRNRLVAAELERRWNEKLAEAEALKARLVEMDSQQPLLTENQRQEIMELGNRFGLVWQNTDCPVELKKKIIRTVIEEILVDMDDEKKMLLFTIHWKGGIHTRFEIPKPPSGVGRKTSMEDLEVIRCLAKRYGDDEIARVLTKLKRRTATGKRWNQSRVKSTRVRYAIQGQSRTKPNHETLTLAQAAKYHGVSDTTIRRLVQAGILINNQTIPWAPWEIQRSGLDSEPVKIIIEELRATGKLRIQGDRFGCQAGLFK